MAGERLTIYKLIAHEPIPSTIGYKEDQVRDKLAQYADLVTTNLLTGSDAVRRESARTIQTREHEFGYMDLSDRAKAIKKLLVRSGN